MLQMRTQKTGSESVIASGSARYQVEKRGT
jgi:hypothetical protein